MKIIALLVVDVQPSLVVCSLIGVVLIARPEFLFGPGHKPATSGMGGEGLGPVERGTPAQRLGAVGYIFYLF